MRFEGTWTPAAAALWHAVERAHAATPDPAPIVSANAWSTRPWTNEYNRGSDRFGFTYVDARRGVWQWTLVDPGGVQVRPDEYGAKFLQEGGKVQF